MLGAAPSSAQQVELATRAAFPVEGAGGTPGAITDDGRYVVFLSVATNLVPGQIDTNASPDVFLYDRVADAVTLVSHVPGSLTMAGDNGCFGTGPVISADGSHIAFVSLASNLTGGSGGALGNVFLYERSSGIVTLVSHAAGNPTMAAGSSGNPQISPTGDFVAFDSSATSLVVGTDTNWRSDVFVYERGTGTIRLVSHVPGATTTTGSAGASGPMISGGGAYIAFHSTSTDLVVGADGNGTFDIFLFERSTGLVSLVSHLPGLPGNAGNGRSSSATITRDGRYLAFASEANNLVADTDGNAASDVFLYDRVTGVVTLVSHAAGAPATSANGWSAGYPKVSADGAGVVFKSGATNLVVGQNDANGSDDTFFYERATGIVKLVSHVPLSETTTGDKGSVEDALSADGTYVAFISPATNLVAGSDANLSYDVFLYERATGAVRLVSHVPASQQTTGNSSSGGPAVSGDGAFVTFTSSASNLTVGADGFRTDTFLFARASGEVTLISAQDANNPSASAEFGGTSGRSALSGDGRYVAITSVASNLVVGQTDALSVEDIFVFDRVLGQMSLVSHAAGSPTSAGNDRSTAPRLSTDGRYVAFVSRSTNLLAGQVDTPWSEDVFLHDRLADEVTLVSHAKDFPLLAAGEPSQDPSLSANGHRVAFTSVAMNLVVGQVDNPGSGDVFLHDRGPDQTSLVSHAAGLPATAASGGSGASELSADGRYVAFLSGATNLVLGQVDEPFSEDVFLYDSVTGKNALVSHVAASRTKAANGRSGLDVAPSVSEDGRYVAFVSIATDLVDGQVDTLDTSDVFLYDRASGDVTLVSHAVDEPTLARGGRALSVSEDGRYVAFVSQAADLVAGQVDGNGADDVFLYDRTTGTSEVVSHSPGAPATTANGVSRAAAIDRTGAYLVFESTATNLLPGQVDRNADVDVFLYTHVTGEVSLASHLRGSLTVSGNRRSTTPTLAFGYRGPVISRQGGVVAFTGEASDLVTRDLNDWEDVFVYSRGCVATGLFAVPNGPNRIDLSWTTPGSYTYSVRRAKAPGGPYTPIGDVLGASYSDMTAAGSVPYYYVVVNDCGVSKEASASTTPVELLTFTIEG
jgi:Tol biopolymer transport system component